VTLLKFRSTWASSDTSSTRQAKQGSTHWQEHWLKRCLRSASPCIEFTLIETAKVVCLRNWWGLITVFYEFRIERWLLRSSRFQIRNACSAPHHGEAAQERGGI